MTRPARRPQANDQPDARAAVCQSLGIPSLAKAHQIIVAGAKKGAEWLLAKRLNAKAFVSLGYDLAGMKRLGYADADLRRLGYDVAGERESRRAPRAPQGEPRLFNEQLADMISSGARASELKAAGFFIHHCKAAGYDARELERLGFGLNELAGEYGIHELKRVGFGINDLKGIFSPQEMKSAGFTATEMRLAGYTVRGLLSFGYTENQVRAAGFSNRDLAREGLARQVVDKTSLQRW